MAKALRPGGLYYTDKGQAVDAEGREVKDAPKPPKDTPPEEQPGAFGAPTPEERSAIALAKALRGELPTQKPKEGKLDDYTSGRGGPGKPADESGSEAGTRASGAKEGESNGGEGGDLDSVDFGSSQAREAAEEEGLTAADFKRKSPSGERGFTKGDVEEIAAAKKGE